MRHSELASRSKGFTLIEIVLVLAIAGLLLVVVFLAVAGAQKARRDNQRKNDLAQFVAAVGNYAANNQLQTPEDIPELNALIANYFASRSDPLTGTQYVGDFWNRGAPHDLPVPDFGHIAFVQGHICSSTAAVTTLVEDPPNYGPYTHVFAGLIQLEQGGAYCISGGN